MAPRNCSKRAGARRGMRRLQAPPCPTTRTRTATKPNILLDRGRKSAEENFTTKNTKNTKKQSASALRRKPPKNFELGNPTDPLDRGCVSRFISCSLAQRFPPISTYKLSTIDFYSNSGLITNMETENNKTTAENDNNASRPSVWGRFMTIYTCLLPIVVLVVLVCCFPVFCDPVSCEIIKSIVWLSVALYYLSVFVSFFLIPIILIGILIYDFFKQKSAVNKSIVNSRKYSQKSTLSRVCNQFHDSFIGEFVHIYLYFVMLGIFPLIYDIWIEGLQGFPFLGFFITECCILYCVLFFFIPCIDPYVILLIFFYVLIRRLSIYYARRIRIYKHQKDKRKEALERIRNNRQDNPPLPPEE